MSRIIAALAVLVLTLGGQATVAPAAPGDDRQGPAITVVRPAGSVDGWYSTAVNVSIYVDDSQTGGSGVGLVTVTMEGAYTMDQVPVSNPYHMRFDRAGSTKITIEATDRADNPSLAVHWVGIDVDAPRITVAGLTDGQLIAQNSSIPLTYQCADHHSGVRNCVATGTAGDFPSGGSISTARLGLNTVTVSARDAVGNIRTQTLTYQVLPSTLRTVVVPQHAPAAKVGDTLVSSVPQFDPYPDQISYQWLRDDTPIEGATASVYRVVAADAGTRLSVVATGTRAGFQAGSAQSDPATVDTEPDPDPGPGDPDPNKPDDSKKPDDGKKPDKPVPTVSQRGKATIRAVLSKKAVKRGKKVTIKIAVQGPAKVSRAGKVTIRVGKGKSKTVRVGKKGVVKVKVKAAKRGKHKVRVKFLGSTALKAASTTKNLRVR